MGSLQGMAVNWWAHKFGYENYKMKNTSKNILPVDFIFWGEVYHNNNHKHPQRPNNKSRWFEWDMGYQTMLFLQMLKIIRIRSQQGDLQTKRTIGCLIFPQKVELDGKSFQTPKMNIVAQCIYQYNNGLGN